ncbi:MAG: autotransporter assembly complex protein TamA [Gammaproteobacteria bacterium]|nr:autotransporter assembly complex protein TamA [Gammaproteobacteria bacterium]
MTIIVTRNWIFVLLLTTTTTLFAQPSVEVIIQGIEEPLLQNTRLLLSIEQQKNHPLLSEGRLRRLHQKASEEITKAIQPFGYYRSKINSNLIQSMPGQWQATYIIEAGPPLPVTEFKLITSEEIDNDPEFQAMIQKIILHKGDVFDHIKYENIKSSMARFAAERGYFNGRFIEHRVEINLKTYEARVYLNYDSGSRYRFGQVMLEQDVLEEELLHRYIPFQQGDPYTLNELINLQQALNDSDYFRSVEISPGELQTDNNEIPVNVVLTPRKQHRFSLGLGYGTDTGARAKFGWEMPRFNQQGHRLSTEAKISEIGYSLTARYRIPVLNPRTDQLIYSAGVINEKTDTSDSTLRTVGASLNHSRDHWRESISLNYQQEEYIVADDSGLSTLLIPGINWSRTWGRDFIYTLDGLRLDIGLRGASEKLISDSDFFQLQGGIKAITSLGEDNRLIGRGALGGIRSDKFNELPSSVRFFAGGANSVRGYGYQTLGPMDSNGKIIGGKYLMIGSIEYEHHLNGKWSAALFYDGGNAINKIEDKLERGSGFGLRWRSPIGPVRIDLASAVSREGRPWRLHINIGPDL